MSGPFEGETAHAFAHRQRGGAETLVLARPPRRGAPPHALAPWLMAPWLAWSLCGVAAAAAALALRAWTPGADPAHTLCAMRRLTGVACATCGMSRAFALLARGEWRASFALHPMASMLAAQLAAGWLLWGTALVRRHSMPDRWLPHAAALNAGALLALWVARLATGALPG